MNQVFVCTTCGTTWIADTKAQAGDSTGWTGFLQSRMYDHWKWCAKAKPAERMKWVKSNQKRLARRPNMHTRLVFNLNHSGLKTIPQEVV